MMDELKAQVAKFSVQKTKDISGTDVVIVNKGAKVFATLMVAGPTSLFIWRGKHLNPKGQLKTSNRTTAWNSQGVKIDDEVKILLYRAVATDLLETVNRMGF